MLNKLENLPEEHLIKKYVELTGESQEETKQTIKEKGIFSITEFIRDYYNTKD